MSKWDTAYKNMIDHLNLSPVEVGYPVKERKNSHPRIYLSYMGRSRFVVVAQSPSDPRSMNNVRALLRRTAKQLIEEHRNGK